MTSMTESIEVDVDPMTAFIAFTDEYDQWWDHGPISAYESWRVIAHRFEPGVGGRIVEDYGDEQRVLGTITTWEPGERVAWRTANEVAIDVTFEAVGASTRVSVTGTVREGVDGNAELSMLRMLPQWFPSHLERRATGETLPDYGRLGVVLRSRTPVATAHWLARVFQLECTGDLPDASKESDHLWIEFRVGTGFIVMWGTADGPSTDSPFVFVDDVEAHCKHAEAEGAEIVDPISAYGFKSYTARDCEGRRWVFAQNGPRIGQ